jgi:hypothetical protein
MGDEWSGLVLLAYRTQPCHLGMSPAGPNRPLAIDAAETVDAIGNGSVCELLLRGVRLAGPWAFRRRLVPR